VEKDIGVEGLAQEGWVNELKEGGYDIRMSANARNALEKHDMNNRD